MYHEAVLVKSPYQRLNLHYNDKSSQKPELNPDEFKLMIAASSASADPLSRRRLEPPEMRLQA